MIQGKEMKSIFRSWSGPRSDMNHFQWIEWIDPRPGRYKEFQFRPSDPSPKKRNNPLTGEVSLRWIISGRKYVSAVTGRPAALIMNKVRVCVFGGRKWRICMMMNNKDIHSRTLTQLDRDGKGKKMHYTQKRGIAAMNQIELGHVSGCRKNKTKEKRTNMAVYNSLPFSWILFCFFFFFHRLFYYFVYMAMEAEEKPTSSSSGAI